MAVTALGLVSQDELINPGAGNDTLTLTMPTIAPAVVGDGAVLVIYVIAGWIEAAVDPTTGERNSTLTISDDVTNPGGKPPNTYVSRFSGQISPIYNQTNPPSWTPPLGTVGGQQIQIIEVEATWGYVSGDAITITTGDTFDYLAAYAYLWRGNGVIPAYLGGSGPQTAIPTASIGGFPELATITTANGGGELNINGTLLLGDYIDGLVASDFASAIYGDYAFTTSQKLVSLVIVEGGGAMAVGSQVYLKTGTITDGSEVITDALGVWGGAEVTKHIAVGDCNIDTGFSYVLWEQTYPGAIQAATSICEFVSSPTRIVSDTDGIFSPAGAMYWMQINDLFVTVGTPVFNTRFPAAANAGATGSPGPNPVFGARFSAGLSAGATGAVGADAEFGNRFRAGA